MPPTLAAGPGSVPAAQLRTAFVLIGVLALATAGAASVVGANDVLPPSGAPGAVVADGLAQLARWGGVEREPVVLLPAAGVVSGPQRADDGDGAPTSTDAVAAALAALRAWSVRPADDIRSVAERAVEPWTPARDADAVTRALDELRAWSAR